MKLSNLVSLFSTLLVITLQISASASPLSERMALSIISREQGFITPSGERSQYIQAGLIHKALAAVSLSESAPYIRRSLVTALPSILDVAGSIDLPLDRFSLGPALLTFPPNTSISQNTTAATAIAALRASLNAQPRNPNGGLWYFVYPSWSYLDGLFGLGSFYALYNTHLDTANGSARADLFAQFDLLHIRCFDAGSGLLRHGYDHSRTAVWADARSGASPIVWGRAVGWYAIALGDVVSILEDEGVVDKGLDVLKSRLREVIRALARNVDGKTGAWAQVLDSPGRKGNYIEASVSAMAIYVLTRGVRMGLLGSAEERRKIQRTVKCAFAYLIKNFVVEEGEGLLGYNGTVGTCSLNSTADYQYYTNQPIVYNSALGAAAFVLAAREAEEIGWA